MNVFPAEQLLLSLNVPVTASEKDGLLRTARTAESSFVQVSVVIIDSKGVGGCRRLFRDFWGHRAFASRELYQGGMVPRSFRNGVDSVG